jgi:hypothetical protein
MVMGSQHDLRMKTSWKAAGKLLGARRRNGWLTTFLSLHMVQTIILFASTQCIHTAGG